MAKYEITVSADSITSFRFTGSDRFGRLDESDNQQLSILSGDEIEFTFENPCDNQIIVHSTPDGDENSNIFASTRGGLCSDNTPVILQFNAIGQYLYRNQNAGLNRSGYISVTSANSVSPPVSPPPPPPPPPAENRYRGTVAVSFQVDLIEDEDLGRYTYFIDTFSNFPEIDLFLYTMVFDLFRK